MEQNDMKSSSRCSCGFEVDGCIKKEEEEEEEEGEKAIFSTLRFCIFFVHMDRLSECKIAFVEDNGEG